MDICEATINEKYFDEVSETYGSWEKSALEQLPSKFSTRCFDINDIYQIYLWKMDNRGRFNTFKFAQDNEPAEVVSAVDRALDASSLCERVRILKTDIAQVGIPTASAILTFVDPEQYTLYDTNVKDALSDLGERQEDSLPKTPTGYRDLVEVCSELADTAGVSLRTLDRGLWLHGSDADYRIDG